MVTHTLNKNDTDNARSTREEVCKSDESHTEGNGDKPAQSTTVIELTTISSSDHANSANETIDTKTPVHFDHLLNQVTGTGKWQFFITSWLAALLFISPVSYLGLIYLGATPEFRCADDYPGNVTFRDIPESASQCYTVAGAPCQSWRYDLDTDGDGADDASTVVSEWDLVCDRKPMLSALQSAIQGGGILGALLAGQLADRVGRRKVYIHVAGLYAVAASLSAAANSYEMYLVCRFVQGVAWIGATNSGMVLALEVVKKEWRALTGQIAISLSSFGQIALAAAAYKIRIWWHLQLMFAALLVAQCLMSFLVPESPRWLILHNREDEAVAVLTSAARVNGRPVPDEGQLRLWIREVRRHEKAEKAEEGTSIRDAISQFWRSRKLRRWTPLVGFYMFGIGFAYYGLHFDVAQLSQNLYLAGVLLGLIDLPTYFQAPLLNRFGRRPMLMIPNLCAGVVMLLFAVKHDPALWLGLGVLSKLAISVVYSLLYIYIPEIFPTSFRTIGFSIATICAQIGGMTSPLVVDMLHDVNLLLPSSVIGGLCLIVAFLVLLLPETAGKRLPETVAELDAGLLDMPMESESNKKEGREGPCEDDSENVDRVDSA